MSIRAAAAKQSLSSREDFQTEIPGRGNACRELVRARMASLAYGVGLLAVNGEQHGFSTLLNSISSARVPSGS